MINVYWTTIGNDISALSSGNLSSEDFESKYQIGGRMIIPIELSDGTSTVADVEIIAHNHDNLADGSGKAPLTFFSKDLPDILRIMNETNTSNGGWEDSLMRTFMNGELLKCLPEELQAIIKPVLKISDGGADNKTLVTTTDSCWLASYDEVGFSASSSSLSGQGEVYSRIFSSDKSSRKKYIVDNTEAGGWWLRSSYYSGTDSSLFIQVTKTGGSYGYFPYVELYVAFGFCI